MEATGFGAEALNNRIVDFGIPAHWTSHHPFTSPEPLTLEPTESFSRAELDELADVYERIVYEAYEEPPRLPTHRTEDRSARCASRRATTTGRRRRGPPGPRGQAQGCRRALMQSLNEKTAIVTGAGSGLGAGIATVLAAEEATVIVADLDRDRAAATVAALERDGRHAIAFSRATVQSC